MCNKHSSVKVPLCKPRQYSKLKYAKVDRCIAPLVAMLNLNGIQTVGCCCGHNEYKPSIMIKKGKKVFDLFSGEVVLRKRRYYKTDKQGYYYIPEVVDGFRRNKKRT